MRKLRLRIEIAMPLSLGECARGAVCGKTAGIVIAETVEKS